MLEDGMVVIYITAIIITILVIILGILLIATCLRRIRLSDDEILREEENQVYLELNSDEQELYFQSKEFLQQHPSTCGDLTEPEKVLIQEKGISAFEFQKDTMLTNNDLIIINKTELNFFKKFECCSMTNLPVPMKNDVYYFEAKIYSLLDPENTIISIGIGAKPYPWFRLPGRHQNSVSYDSTGHRRLNQPFKFHTEVPPLPTFIEGDVIGIGYRTRSGTIFLTRNGKKVNETSVGGHIKHFKPCHGLGQIFPVIGANNLCSVHVNLGQAGFVFIEGNVKKWGYAPIEGSGPSPPAYNKFNSDILLERSEVDENDLEERVLDFPPDFWEVHNNKNESADMSFDGDKYSYNAYSEVNSSDERISLHSIPNFPPLYQNQLDTDGDTEEGTDAESILEREGIYEINGRGDRVQGFNEATHRGGEFHNEVDRGSEDLTQGENHGEGDITHSESPEISTSTESSEVNEVDEIDEVDPNSTSEVEQSTETPELSPEPNFEESVE